MRGGGGWLVALACLAAPAASFGQSGVIVDPENPGAAEFERPASPSTGTIVDPENPGAAELQGHSMDGAGLVIDPENPGAPSPIGPAQRSTATEGPAPQRVVFRGDVRSTLSLDTRHDGLDEDTFESLQQLGMRARVTLGARWTATVEGRLSWWLTSGPGDPDDAVVALDPDRWQGRLAPELRDFYVAGRRGGWSWRLGQLVVAWGSSDIVNPANVVNPRDLRFGLLASPDDATVPVPAADMSIALPSLLGQFVVVPFFVPDRLPIYGSDTALLRPASPLVGSLPLDRIGGILDPSIEDVVQPAVQQTHLPEEHPANASVGTRWTWTWRGLDLSGGAFYGFDRQPSVEVADPLAAWIATSDARDDLFTLDAETLDLVAAVQDGETLVDARYARRLDLVADGVRYFGPIGVRFDAVYTPQRTINVDGLTSVRRPRFAGTLGLGYESPTGDVVISTEAFIDRTWLRGSDPDAVLGLDDLVGAAFGMAVDAEAFTGSDAALAPLEVQLAALTLPREGDVVLTSAVGWAFTEASTLSVGATIVHTTSSRVTPGDLYDTNDAVFVRFDSAF